MRFLRRALSGLFLISVTIGVLAFGVDMLRGTLAERANREERSFPSRERVFAVNVVPFEPGQITPQLRAFGEVQSRRTLDIRPATGGTVVEVAENVIDGGRVEAGQLLLRLDPANAATALTLREADLAEAEAELREARRALTLAGDEVLAAEVQADLRNTALERQRSLVERGVGTSAAVEQAELALSSAQASILSRRLASQQAEARVDLGIARVSRAQVNVAEAKRNLSETAIHAEFSGTLAEVSITRGGIVSNGERLAQLVDRDALEVAIRVSTQQYSRLVNDGRLTDAAVTITLDVMGQEVAATGQLVRESPAVGEGQTGRLLYAAIEGASTLRPGDFVSVAIQEPAIGFAALLPATAVSNDEVLVVGEGDRLEAATVRLLRRQGDNVIVRSRDLAGRRIVAERSPVLGAGIKVRPLSPDTPMEAEAPATIALDPDRRAKLIAFVDANTRMPAAAKQRVLDSLQKDKVPEALVTRLEGRMGG